MDESSDSPTTWSWKCHKCNRSYPMACTQRCLLCSHTICFPSTDTKQDSRSSCRIVFDLPCWRDIYKRRRELIQQNSSNEEQQMAVADEAPEQHTEVSARDEYRVQPEWLVKMANGTHNCFTDCEFPSECFFKIAIDRISRPSNPPPPPPSSSPSLSQPASDKLLKTPKRGKKYKSRGRNSFQKVPSPLRQEWHIDDTVSGEVNHDAVKL